MLLFLFFLGIELLAIHILFDDPNIVLFVSTLLILECSFIAWFQWRCHQHHCNDQIRQAIKHFSRVFLILGIGSMMVFALRDFEVLESDVGKAMRLLFWFMFAALTLIGIRLTLTPPDNGDDNDTPDTTDADVYGKSGYKN
ncbi:MAG TPA: hypothetical protein PLB10_03955 [Thiolinea sp.]|nr:hypothetical protein [Thiolinea sp.]